MASKLGSTSKSGGKKGFGSGLLREEVFKFETWVDFQGE